MFGNKQKPKITSNKNITTIETGTGTYTILYGLHVVAQNPDEVPDRINGIILETGIQQWLEDPVKTTQRLKNICNISCCLIDWKKKKSLCFLRM
jgi:hypothetical protein